MPNGNANGNSHIDVPALSGTRRTYEKVTVKPQSLADLMQEIHRLGHTGQCTIHVKNGTSVSVDWERETTREDRDK